MTMIKVAPARGRTVRFPAGHELQGEMIPPEGGLVDAASAFIKRYMLTGDLVVLTSASKPSPLRRTVGLVYKAPAPASESSLEGVEALDFTPDELRAWPIRKLTDLAERAGIAIPPKASKQDLINAITAAASTVDDEAGDESGEGA
jgi:hypothetical protein